MKQDSIRQEIIAMVKRIPKGRVATYGQIATLAGRPRNARQVGTVLKSMPDDSRVPWHRVVNAQGLVSERGNPTSEGLQRFLLRSELVELDEDGRIDLEEFQWTPRTQ